MNLALWAVTSSTIEAIGFDFDSERGAAMGRLYVRFKPGRKQTGPGDTYGYDDVPHELYLRLRAAESAGKLFQAEVRDKYRTWKLISEAPEAPEGVNE